MHVCEPKDLTESVKRRKSGSRFIQQMTHAPNTSTENEPLLLGDMRLTRIASSTLVTGLCHACIARPFHIVLTPHFLNMILWSWFLPRYHLWVVRFIAIS